MLNVLLVCGSGASSGFMAANIRKEAKEKGVEITVQARSDSEIDNYIEDVDLIMVGPHLEYIMNELEEYTNDYPIKIALMKPDYYSRLNGAEALEHILSLYK